MTDHFDHTATEPAIASRWERGGAFRADAPSSRPPFCMVMPPPNATGTLHVGHASMIAIEDALVRWRRMRGDEVLWLPGTDHAAIATESVVIRRLQAEGVADPRAALGREELLRRIAAYVEGSRETIRAQIRGMGASCDWSRERFTLDPQCSRCVASTFAQMARDGLVYRADRIVNWDAALRTTVSDDETYHETRDAEMYVLRYGPLLVATSRPETKLGDTAVAVHPDDGRWRDFIGRTVDVELPRGGRLQVPVVAEDRLVDPTMGTGAVGVTPAHSATDFEIARKHGLPFVQVIGEDGRMTEAAGPYAGMEVLACRRALVEDLRAAGLLVEVRRYAQPTALWAAGGGAPQAAAVRRRRQARGALGRSRHEPPAGTPRRRDDRPRADHPRTRDAHISPLGRQPQ